MPINFLMSQESFLRAPLVSVIMPVYNAAPHLAAAIDSILNQSLQDYEFIIINDGSTDDSLAVLSRYQDPKIIIFNQTNQGIVKALNVGLSLAKGKFIARMDADDISTQDRFEKQVNYLESKLLDLCGCQLMVMNEKGWIYRHVAMPTTADWMAVTLACTVPFAHGSVMMRRSFLDSKSLSYLPGLIEDYSLWCSMYEHGAQIGNLNEELYIYREHKSLSKLRISDRQIAAYKQRREFVKKSFSSLRESIIQIVQGPRDYPIKQEAFLLLASFLLFVQQGDLLVFRVLKRVSFASILVALFKLLKGF